MGKIILHSTVLRFISFSMAILGIQEISGNAYLSDKQQSAL